MERGFIDIRKKVDRKALNEKRISMIREFLDSIKAKRNPISSNSRVETQKA